MPATNSMPQVETLQRILDELCAPELTLRRAKVLRGRLFELLDVSEPQDALRGRRPLSEMAMTE
jgi:hypothetical protein